MHASAMASCRRVVASAWWSSVASGCCSIEPASRMIVAGVPPTPCFLPSSHPGAAVDCCTARPGMCGRLVSSCQVSLSCSTCQWLRCVFLRRHGWCVSEATLNTAVQLQQCERLTSRSPRCEGMAMLYLALPVRPCSRRCSCSSCCCSSSCSSCSCSSCSCSCSDKNDGATV